MSDLPCEITMQILVAPARIIRSSRYSETALGRSVSPSVRLPTGSSSLEKARGWMRLPTPAAGTIPQMLVMPRLLAGRLVPPLPVRGVGRGRERGLGGEGPPIFLPSPSLAAPPYA